MLLYVHWKNEINKISSQVSFKLFMSFFDKNYSAELLSEAYLIVSILRKYIKEMKTKFSFFSFRFNFNCLSVIY